MIAEINRQGVTVVLVEQNAAMALAVADRAIVLEVGQVALEGTAAELRRERRGPRPLPRHRARGSRAGERAAAGRRTELTARPSRASSSSTA